MLGHRVLSVEDYLTILKRRWWIIAIPALLLPIVGYGVSFLIPPQYVSQTLVLINQQRVPENFVPSVVSEDLNNRLAYMKEQILSRASLEPIIKKYNLYESLGSDIDARVKLAQKATKVEPIRSDIHSSGLPGFNISFTASDPQTAQQVCQEITSLFTSTNTRIRGQAAQSTVDFLTQQVAAAKANLDDLDQKLAAFKLQHAGELPDDTQQSTQILTSLSNRLDATTQQLNGYQQSKTMVESALAQQEQAFAAQPMGSATRSPDATEKELENLQTQESDLSVHYTDDYPALKRVRARIAELQKQMAKQAQTPPPPAAKSNRLEPASITQLRTQIKVLDSAIAQKRREQEQIDGEIRRYQGKLAATPLVEGQEKELTRDYTTSLEAYNALKAKLDAATMGIEMEHQSQGETFSLVDAANLPESPNWPKRPLFAIGGLAAGLALGLGIVALIEYRDTALRSERDVWAFTQLPTLAVIAWTENVATTRQSGLSRLFRKKSADSPLADAPG